LNKINVENKENEKNYNLNKKECIIDIELFQYDKEFVLRFLRLSGELEDFYNNLKKIYAYAEDLLK
jgi:hypothetical protein